MKIYQNKVVAQNFNFEIFILYIPTQNNYIECQGHMFIAKACVICIIANLLQNFWSEVVKAINYITDKIFIK